MSNTLKIEWKSFEDNVQTDGTRLFIPVDELHVHGEITKDSDMKHWDGADYFDYRWVQYSGEDYVRNPGYLMNAIKDGQSKWYIATNAWLLGDTGSTIERVAP